jgi:hypothetical protein
MSFYSSGSFRLRGLILDADRQDLSRVLRSIVRQEAAGRLHHAWKINNNRIAGNSQKPGGDETSKAKQFFVIVEKKFAVS